MWVRNAASLLYTLPENKTPVEISLILGWGWKESLRALAGAFRANFRKKTIMLFENLSPIADNRILRLSH